MLSAIFNILYGVLGVNHPNFRFELELSSKNSPNIYIAHNDQFKFALMRVLKTQ
jgi:hypothetical protein